jgi:DNA-binding PadR family transcriptional regulator
MPGRVLGLYALSAMDRDGRLYGYELAERIAQRTEGTWRPGPGAIYPALEALADRGLARSKVEGRRRVYQITREGRTFLRHLRRQMLWRSRGGPDLGALWSEISGHNDPGQFRLERLQHQVDSMNSYLERAEANSSESRALRRQLRDLLRRAQLQLERSGPARGPAPTRSRRGLP